MSAPPLRILIAKPGLDGHDRGARMVARSLQDAGFEVRYTGIRWTPEEIAQEVIEFNADLVGISILSGSHLELVPRVLAAMATRGLETMPVILGGIIPEYDRATLLEMGIAEIFTPGARMADIIETLERILGFRSRA